MFGIATTITLFVAVAIARRRGNHKGIVGGGHGRSCTAHPTDVLVVLLAVGVVGLDFGI